MSFNELITNGSFETGALIPWAGPNVTITNLLSHSGLYAARFTSGNTNAFIFQYVPVNSGERYELLVSLGKIGTATSPQVSISVAYYDEALNFLEYGLIINYPMSFLPNVNERDWIEVYRTTSPAPTGATQALVLVNKLPETGTAGILVDDVSLLAVIGDGMGPTGPTGPIGPAGPTGPEGPKGRGSILFSSEDNDPLSLLPVETVRSLTLPTVITNEGEHIKLDSTFRVYFETTNTSSHNLDISYVLRRLGDEPETLTSAPVNRSRTFSTNTATSDTYFPNITWIDSPPPGTHIYQVDITALTANNISVLEVTNRSLNAVAQISFDPFNVYVQAGAENGNGTLENPFGTIEEGMAVVAEGGTVHILEGIYNIDPQLIITKPLTLRGFTTDPYPQIVFSTTTNVDGLVIESDDVTIKNLHVISNRSVTGDNAVVRVPLRTLANLYRNITIRSCIIEGTTRSGYIWAENMTIEDTEFIHNAINTQGLRFQMVRGETNILNNIFHGGSTSVGAIVFEPNILPYVVSGTIRVIGNTMTSFTQFVNFFCRLEGPTSLFVEDNNINHMDRSGSSIILFSRVNYALMEEILIQNNTFVNIHPTRLAVYFVGADGSFVPEIDQIQVYFNTFNFPNGYGNVTDTVDPEFPVGYGATAPAGTTLAIFDLNGNVNV